MSGSAAAPICLYSLRREDKMTYKFFTGFCAAIFAASAPFCFLQAFEEPSGTILDIGGKVTILREDKWDDAEKFAPVYEKSFVKTDDAAFAEIMFDDETAVRFEENTEAEILSTGGALEVSLKSGRVTSSVVPSEEAVFFVSSPLAIIGVRGTEFTVTHNGKETAAAVYKGKVEVENRGKSPKRIKVASGNQSFVYEGFQPSEPVGLGPEYVKYRKKVLDKFVKRTIKNRKNKEKILLKRMESRKSEKEAIIEEIKGRKIIPEKRGRP